MIFMQDNIIYLMDLKFVFSYLFNRQNLSSKNKINLSTIPRILMYRVSCRNQNRKYRIKLYTNL